ncbi:MAG: hypothetical protein ACRD5H_04360 [Nitrososphaerales archaeon]
MSLLTDVVSRVLSFISKGAGRLLVRFFRGTSTIIEKTFEAFAWPFTGAFLLLLITTTIAEGSEKLSPAFRKLIDLQLPKSALSFPLSPIAKLVTFEQIAQQAGSFFFENLLNLFEVEGPLTPEVGRRNAQKFVGLNVLINITSWVTQTFADTLSLGKFESIGKLPQNMSWALGLGWLTWVVVGPPLQLLIADPMVEGFNRKHPINKLTMAQIIDFYKEGLKSKEWFKDRMLSLGFDEDMAFTIWEGARKKLTRAQARRFFERGVISKDDLRDIVKKEGWNDDELDLLVDEIVNERTFELTEDIVKTALNLFENGQVTESVAEGYLRKANWSGDEIELALELGKLRKLRTDLSPSQLLNLMGDKFLTASQVQIRLQAKGYDVPDAQLLIQQEILSRKPATKPPAPAKEVTLTQAQVLSAYRQGAISEAEARERLKDLGLNNADINLLIRLNKPTVQ